MSTIGSHPFVSLTTFRGDGSPVSTPMWVADDGGTLVFTTPADTAKVRRLRRDPRVTLRPCTRMGTVADDAPTWTGTAQVREDDDASAQAALRRKYGWQFRVVLGLERLLARRNRDRVILRVTGDG